jgi:ubiquitin-protein ligase
MRTSYERRLTYEWDCLQQLMTEAPDKLCQARRIDDHAFLLSVAMMPALSAQPGQDWQPNIKDNHQITLSFPRYYPAVPSEIFLSEPVFHPNVDAVNGFVCLWDKHRVANTARHALAKLASVLAWRLLNADAPHLMQPSALDWYHNSPDAKASLPLNQHPWILTSLMGEDDQRPRRWRLS